MTLLSVVFWGLGIVLVVSGVLKLADPAPAAAMLRELSSATRRVPVRLIGICELSLGLAAVVAGGRATALLMVTAYMAFATVSAMLSHRGDGAPPCGCFGSRPAPASSAHVFVNLGAALVAAFAVVTDVPGAFPGHFTAGGVLRVGLACPVAALVIALLRRNPAAPASAGGPGQPLARTEAAPHDVEGTTPAGEALVVAVKETEHKTVLAFLAVGCGTCAHFWQEPGADQAAEFAAHHTKVVLVTRGPDRLDPKAVEATAPPRQLTVMSSQAWEQYEVPWNPYFIVVDGPSSTILAEGTAGSWDDVLALVMGEGGSSPREPSRTAEEFPRSWLHPGVEVRSGADGSGLVARQSFRADEVVIVLAGLHASSSQAQTLVSRNAAAPHPIMLDDNVYLLQAPDDEAAYTNHSCNPTIWLDEDYSLLARREIGAGDELTIDYATMVADPGWQMACRCGSANCRGVIGGEDWKLPGLQARYAGHFVTGIAASIAARSGAEADWQAAVSDHRLSSLED